MGSVFGGTVGGLLFAALASGAARNSGNPFSSDFYDAAAVTAGSMVVGGLLGSTLGSALMVHSSTGGSDPRGSFGSGLLGATIGMVVFGLAAYGIVEELDAPAFGLVTYVVGQGFATAYAHELDRKFRVAAAPSSDPLDPGRF